MKNNHNPLVSVVMPVYNAGEFIVEAIKSIQNQTYENWELIVVDDGSIDNSFSLIQNLAVLDKRIKLYRNEKNLGIGKTMNKLLALGKGNFIARMDADDIAFPQRLEKEVEFLQKNPEIGIVGSYMAEVNTNRYLTNVRKVPLTHELIAKQMYFTQTIQNPTLMINKKKIASENLYYDGSFSPVDDFDFFVRQLGHGVKFANIPEYLMAYRKHDNNSSLKNIKKTFNLTCEVRKKASGAYGLKVTFSAKATEFLQKFLINILPEKVIYSLFKLLKGGLKSSIKGKLIDFSSSKTEVKLSLVVPVYKAENHIEKDINELTGYLKKNKIAFEIIAVVDGFVDSSYAILNSLVNKNGDLRVFGYQKNKGKGFAVRYGLNKAKYDYVGYLDAGGDIDYSSINFVLENITRNKEIDAFIGDKKHLLSLVSNITLLRRVASKVFIRIVNFLLDTPFEDTQVGFKFFKKKVIKAVLAELPVGINRFAFDAEILKVMADNGYKIQYCPVIINKAGNISTVKVKDVFIMLKDLFSLSLHYFERNIRLNMANLKLINVKNEMEYERI